MNLHNLYYAAKPFIPCRLRLALRRLHAARVRSRCTRSWPIAETAGATPDGWPGWPGGKRFAFVVTHDVEGTVGLQRSRRLAELEITLGFRSAFNFVPEGEYRVPDALKEFLESNGFEVGVHDLHHDGSLYASWDQFQRSAKTINRYAEEWGAVGFRSGFMRHDLKWLDELNVLYDSSTFDTDPFEPQPDGVSTIFPFWASQNGRTGYVELPSTLPQDSTLFRILKETSVEIWKRKVDWVAEKGGLALVIIHPDYISFDGRIQTGEYRHGLLEEFLGYVRDRYAEQCWFALPKEVAHHVYTTMVPTSFVNRRMGPQRKTASEYYGMQAEPARSLNSSTVDAPAGQEARWSCLQGKRMVAVSFSPFPGDPRPRRAAESFVSAGMTVDIICLAEEGRPSKESWRGITIDRVSIRKHRGPTWLYLWQYCSFLGIVFLKLAVRSLGRRYDIVHIHNMPDVLVFAALVPKLLGAKVILDLHDPMPELMRTIFGFAQDSAAVKWMARLEKWSIGFADKVITVNKACKQLFALRSCAPEKVAVIMNAPDEKIFNYVPAKQRKEGSAQTDVPFVIMYHGTIVERNGLDLAVEALETVRQSVPTVELRIYGPRTPFLDRVMEAVIEKGLEKSVQYLGPRRLEELVQAIQECDVGVIPNKRSIFTEINTPTRIFEYLALGKPVVAPRASGIQNYFAETELIYFDLGSAGDLARALVWAAAHSDEVLEKTIQGQSVYRTHSWKKEQAQLLALGETLIHKERVLVA